MSEFVKRTMMGYKEVPGGHSDPECTHVILTLKEYDQLLQEKSRAEMEARIAESDAEKKIVKAKNDAAYTEQQARQEAQEQVEAIQGEPEQERAESAHQRALNANLLRITKERANAERGLKPKKERSGYIVVFSEEKEYSFRDDRKRMYKVKLWETILQSPYSVEFSEEVARKQMEDELFPKDGEWLIARIGIVGKFNKGYEEMQEARDWNPEDPFYSGNVMIARQMRLKRNFRSRYWEVSFVHTKPLGDVPADLMPEIKKPVQGA